MKTLKSKQKKPPEKSAKNAKMILNDPEFNFRKSLDTLMLFRLKTLCINEQQPGVYPHS